MPRISVTFGAVLAPKNMWFRLGNDQRRFQTARELPCADLHAARFVTYIRLRHVVSSSAADVDSCLLQLCVSAWRQRVSMFYKHRDVPLLCARLSVSIFHPNPNQDHRRSTSNERWNRRRPHVCATTLGSGSLPGHAGTISSEDAGLSIITSTSYLVVWGPIKTQNVESMLGYLTFCSCARIT